MDSSTFRYRVRDSIMLGGLTAASLEILPALVVHASMGIPPAQVFQAIASGLLGKAAFRGELQTALLGAALHLVISLVAAGVFATTSRRVMELARRPFLFGALFGLAAYAFMNFLIVPMSAFPFKPETRWHLLAASVLTHVVLFGIPIAWFARSTRPTKHTAGCVAAR
jgi:hypothetical protein